MTQINALDFIATRDFIMFQQLATRASHPQAGREIWVGGEGALFGPISEL